MHFLRNFVPILVWEVFGAGRYGFIAFYAPGQAFLLEERLHGGEASGHPAYLGIQRAPHR